jgi:hypothetical protein
MGGTSEWIEAGTVDTDDGAQMRPFVGAMGTRQQEDVASDLTEAFTVESASIRCIDVTVLEAKRSPVQELGLGTLEAEEVMRWP